MNKSNNAAQTTNETQTILIIEDDRMVSSLIKASLEKAGFFVYQIYQGDNAPEAVVQYQPDLILLDIGLPDIDGFQVCQNLRALYAGPIVILTSKSEDEQQIKGFESGADDYLTKPISPSLLKIRLDLYIKRAKNKNSLLDHSAKQIGNLTLDLNAHTCIIDNDEVKLSSFEFKLLNLLMENKGTLLSRDRIYNALMRRNYNGTERTVDVRMAKLRETLSFYHFEGGNIETVWGQGYVLNELQEQASMQN